MFENYTDTLVSLVVNAILSRQPGHASLLYFTQMPRTFVFSVKVFITITMDFQKE